MDKKPATTLRTLGFHPLLTQWFEQHFEAPTDIQLQGWGWIGAGNDTLVSAPTGSGKTLAAFLWAINKLVEEAAAGELEERVHVVYVSPLKALGNDIEKNLASPLAAIAELARTQGLDLAGIRTAVRSGDTPQRDRLRMIKHPPHILITTPESLYILLTAEKSRRVLAGARTVIVDEIHAIAQDKRGAHLALSLERLDRLAGRPLQRIGLSATQKPIEEVARLLVGAGRVDDQGNARCKIVDAGHKRTMDLSVEVPDFELGPIATHELQAAIYDAIAEHATKHRSTIVFVNTRRLVERTAHALSDRLGKNKVAAHHGSLSRETRLAAEQSLKSGELPVIVATASLELGIDVGHVDLVCHIGASRALATFLQRVGRSGHFLGAVPKGIFFPLTRDDLMQCAAAVRAVQAGALDRLEIPSAPLDILAQQMVATVASEVEGTEVEGLWESVRRTWPYRDLDRKDFDEITEMVAEGVSTRRGRRAAHLHYDRVGGRLTPRRGARLTAITSGGAIPDTADFDVVVEPEGTFVGKVNEDFAIESLAGDIFQLGNHSWRIRRVEAGRIRVVDAGELPPTIPFWLGEAPGRTLEMSEAVCDLRRELAERRNNPIDAARWLVGQCGVSEEAGAQMVTYVSETMTMLGAVPTMDTVIAERFFDEAGGMQLVLHTPWGARINRALGLSIRKRFCVSFDFELQAAATDDGVVLSLGEQHSFPLETVFSFVRPGAFLEDLTQSLLASPMFTNRWRWNATRALALVRFRGGKKIPLQIQRMQAEDLLGAVFPEQLGCQDNRMGNIEPPDHPLVRETLDNCLHEAMDARGLERMLQGIEDGSIRTIAVETPAPSPMSHEILGANPWAFLDGAPLEERRARAVSLRRTDPDLASGIGALDESAVAEVRRQAWPEARNADEVHDALLTLCLLPLSHADGWQEQLNELEQQSRVARVTVEKSNGASSSVAWVAAERARLIAVLYPECEFEPPFVRIPDYPRSATGELDEETASLEVIRGWMDSLGPTTATDLAATLDWPVSRVSISLARLESQGAVLQGSFTTRHGDEPEWCERGLLARIHRLTLGRLRREIEPVSPADFMRFLLRWQRVAEGSRLHGREGVRAVIAQLQGLELPGPAWEQSVLPARIAGYDPAHLEELCLAGEVAWGRLAVTLPDSDEDGTTVSKRRRVPTRSAPLAFFLREDSAALLEPLPENADCPESLSPIASDVLQALENRGASFLNDLARTSGRLPTEVEDGLWELVSTGLVTGDGVAGLRTLLLPEQKRKRARPSSMTRGAALRAIGGGRSPRRMMPTGRWSLLRAEFAAEDSETSSDARDEQVAQRLLARWGVVLRELCVRERHLPPWRRLLWALRRLEARGEVRGGRFVAGFVGEQFALAEAVESLRAVRRDKPNGDVIVIPAADPLNLVGIIAPSDAKVSPFSNQVIAWRDGVAIEVGDLGTVRSRLSRALPGEGAGV
ncbi:MAG: ATP-dependent Lhr-like helicase [Hyphomicrobiaceae bacterium]|jgi:ATP-dependent Lhr-like helicase